MNYTISLPTGREKNCRIWKCMLLDIVYSKWR